MAPSFPNAAEAERLMALVRDAGHLTPGEAFLLSMLLSRVAEGQTQPVVALDELARWTKLSEAETLRTIQKLEERGRLRVICRTMHGAPAAYEIDEAALVRLRRPGADRPG